MIHGLGPRTRRIYAELQLAIRSGDLRPGTRLPSHKRLAADYGVAPMTIRHVLARLEDAGLVSRQPGRGTFVSAGPRAPVLAQLHPQRLFEGLPDAALVVDRVTGEVVRWNAAAEPLRGEPAATMAELAIRTAGQAGAEPVQVTVVGGDGHEMRLELVVRDVGEDLLLVVAHDQTRQLATQDALAFQARLLDAVEQAVVATDPLANIIYWNRAAERLYGWRSEEVVGRSVGEVIVAPSMRERGREIMARLRLGETWTGEFPLMRRDGTEISVLVTDSPIRDEDGRLVGIIGVAMDVTEQKQAERDRLERARLEMLLRETLAEQRELSRELEAARRQTERG